MEHLLTTLTVLFLVFGLFFMFVGALGLVRMPDLYNRMHATTKCVTLGISFLLLGAALGLREYPHVNLTIVFTKVAMVVIFQFVAAPVGAHLLGKAAHLDRSPIWHGTLGDELEEDQPR